MKRPLAILLAAVIALVVGTLATVSTGLLVLFAAMIIYLPPSDYAWIVVSAFAVVFFGIVATIVFREMMEKFTG